MDLRLGWNLGLEADLVKARKRLSVEKPHLLILSPMCLASSVAGAQTDWQNCGNRAGITWSLLAVCAGRARWTRSLRTSLGGDVVEGTVSDKVSCSRLTACARSELINVNSG